MFCQRIGGIHFPGVEAEARICDSFRAGEPESKELAAPAYTGPEIQDTAKEHWLLRELRSLCQPYTGAKEIRRILSVSASAPSAGDHADPAGPGKQGAGPLSCMWKPAHHAGMAPCKVKTRLKLRSRRTCGLSSTTRRTLAPWTSWLDGRVSGAAKFSNTTAFKSWCRLL